MAKTEVVYSPIWMNRHFPLCPWQIEFFLLLSKCICLFVCVRTFLNRGYPLWPPRLCGSWQPMTDWPNEAFVKINEEKTSLCWNWFDIFTRREVERIWSYVQPLLVLGNRWKTFAWLTYISRHLQIEKLVLFSKRSGQPFLEMLSLFSVHINHIMD